MNQINGLLSKIAFEFNEVFKFNLHITGENIFSFKSNQNNKQRTLLKQPQLQ